MKIESTSSTIAPHAAQVNAPAEVLPSLADFCEPVRPKRRPAFEQAALTSLERCALYLIPHLPHKEYEQLVEALWAVRRALGLPPPHHPMLDLRDWPDDAQAGDTLEVLLGRLDELERQP